MGMKVAACPFCPPPSPPTSSLWHLSVKPAFKDELIYFGMLFTYEIRLQSFPMYKIDIVDIPENLLCFAGFSATLIYAIKIWLFLKLHYFNASTRQLKSFSPCHISSD